MHVFQQTHRDRVFVIEAVVHAVGILQQNFVLTKSLGRDGCLFARHNCARRSVASFVNYAWDIKKDLTDSGDHLVRSGRSVVKPIGVSGLSAKTYKCNWRFRRSSIASFSMNIRSIEMHFLVNYWCFLNRQGHLSMLLKARFSDGWKRRCSNNMLLVNVWTCLMKARTLLYCEISLWKWSAVAYHGHSFREPRKNHLSTRKKSSETHLIGAVTDFSSARCQVPRVC